MLLRQLSVAAVAVMLLPWDTIAQEVRVERERTPAPRARAWTIMGDEEERAALGVGTSSGGERDTLGLLITSISPGGPAEKAGLEEGNRIAAINGVRLTLSAADAGEPDMHGILSRRLTRELGKVKPGDNVELRVYDDGQFRNMRVTTVAAVDLPGRKRVREIDLDERPVLGLGLGTSGSNRDTLGVFVSSVLEDGPAEKAGIFEGDRIASINGVDVRVRAEDAGDAQVAQARIQRFRREISTAKPGDQVELRVWSDGGYKNVRVTLGKASDFKGRRGMSFHYGDFDMALPALAPMPPMPPIPPMPGFHGEFDVEFDVDREAIGEAAREAVRAVRVSTDAMRHAAAEARAHAVTAAREARIAARYNTGWF